MESIVDVRTTVVSVVAERSSGRQGGLVQALLPVQSQHGTVVNSTSENHRVPPVAILGNSSNRKEISNSNMNSTEGFHFSTLVRKDGQPPQSFY